MYSLPLRSTRLQISPRTSPELTGHALDLLLEIQGCDAPVRAALEAQEARALRFFHGGTARVQDGTFQWTLELGDLHSFTPRLPEAKSVRAELREVRAFAQALRAVQPD